MNTIIKNIKTKIIITFKSIYEFFKHMKHRIYYPRVSVYYKSLKNYEPWWSTLRIPIQKNNEYDYKYETNYKNMLQTLSKIYNTENQLTKTENKDKLKSAGKTKNKTAGKTKNKTTNKTTSKIKEIK